MKGQMDTQYGKILIDEDVIATYAGSVAVDCFGIVGMAAVNMKDGLVKLLKKDYLESHHRWYVYAIKKVLYVIIRLNQISEINYMDVELYCYYSLALRGSP